MAIGDTIRNLVELVDRKAAKYAAEDAHREAIFLCVWCAEWKDRDSGEICKGAIGPLENGKICMDCIGQHAEDCEDCNPYAGSEHYLGNEQGRNR